MEVTRLLLAWRGGDEAAFAQLMPLVYDELRRLAGHYMRRERPDHTLQSSALVHEAYLRLVEHESIEWQNRALFRLGGAGHAARASGSRAHAQLPEARRQARPR